MRRAAVESFSKLTGALPPQFAVAAMSTASPARQGCVLRTWDAAWGRSERAASGDAAGDANEEDSGPTGPLIGTRDDPSTGPPIVVSVTEEKRHAAAAHDTYKHFMQTHTIHYEQPVARTRSSAADSSQTPAAARQQGQGPSKVL